MATSKTKSKTRSAKPAAATKPKAKAASKSDNKTKPTQLSVTEFLAALPDEARRTDARVLVALMRRVTGETPQMWGPSIIGFGSYHYVYESGREGDAPLVGFSPRKPATVMYLMLGLGDSSGLLAKLGKHTTGKGCLYVKRLADVDVQVLEALVAKAFAAVRAKYPD